MKAPGKVQHRPRLLLFFGSSGRSQPASGPLMSIAAMVKELAGEFRFSVIAAPDLFAASPENDAIRQDIGSGNCHLSFTGDWRSWIRLARLVKDTPHDVLHLNSFFDREFTIPILMMRKLGLVPRKPVVLSPRGEFAPGALSIKPRRKQAYIALARRLGLLSRVWLHATAEHEAADMERMKLGGRGILLAPNPARLFDLPKPSAKPSGEDRLRIAFFGRLTPVKNVAFALDVLSNISTPIDFDIYGPVGDPNYWETCQKQIGNMSDRVRIGVKGAIPNSHVPETLASYDLFFLPTLGENFGQAIHEALASGVPVLISDRTPWRGLTGQNAGWELPLDSPDRFAKTIDAFAEMNEADRRRLRQGARRLAERRHGESDAIGKHRAMFRKVMAAGA